MKSKATEMNDLSVFLNCKNERIPRSLPRYPDNE